MKPQTIECAEVLELLLDVERDSTAAPGAPERAGALEAHLRACAACAAESARLHSALQGLRTEIHRIDPLIDVWGGVRATLVAEGRLAGSPAVAATSEARPARTAYPLRRLAGRVAVAAALLAGAVLFFQRSGAELRPEIEPAGAARGPAIAAGTSPQPVSDSPLTTPQAEPLAAAPAPESLLLPASAGGLRRAPGEERRRDIAVPFEASGETGGWSLASDRELR